MRSPTRFSEEPVYNSKQEMEALYNLLRKHLVVEIPGDSSFFGTANEDRYRRFIRRTVLKISRVLYKIISDQAGALNLYTYELRNGSKAETVFLREVDISDEDALWKELLIFFMNTQSSTGYLEFLRSITPLEFDPGLVGDYLDCFQSDAAKSFVMGELEHHYEGLGKEQGHRLEMINIIGAPNVCFDSPEDQDEVIDS